MDKGLLDFISGSKSSVLVNAMLVKSVFPNGTQQITLEVEGKELYTFCHNPNKKKAKDPNNPKNTGGKQPYLMVMTKAIEELRKMKLPNLVEITGFLFFLGPNIEWKTGRLINKRSKKSLNRNDIGKIVPWSRYKIDKMIIDLEEQDLLFKTSEGFFVSRNIIKKGANRNGR